MSDKYIIKNCPCYDDYFNPNETCRKKYSQFCQDCTACVLKQIVELCKGVKCPCEYKGADCWECTQSGARRFADRILKLIDIQEVE